MSSFSEFQKSEYEHIAEAHFKAIEAISFFFRYYLLVMSLPIPVHNEEAKAEAAMMNAYSGAI